jgi:outer membrane protein TolC
MNAFRQQNGRCPTHAASRAFLVAAVALPLFTSSGERAPALAAVQATPPAPNLVTTPVPPPVVLPGLPAALSVVPPPAAVTNRPLTADEAAQIALARQPSIVSAAGQVTAARGRTQQARAGLLPVLSMSAGYTRDQQLRGRGVGTGDDFVTDATLSQLIFDFNHTRDLVRQARALEQASARNVSATQANVVQQVKQAFYQYVQSRQLVGVNQQNVANSQSQLDLANARYRVGLGLPSDVANAQTALSEAVQNLVVAQNSDSAARVNLAVQIGIDPRTPIQPADSVESPLASSDVNGFVQTALRQRPEILQARATLEADRYALRAARTSNAPTLRANLGFNSDGTQYFPQNQGFTAGATVQFNPFDGGLSAGMVKEARGNLVSAQAQLLSEQIAVASDVSLAYLDVRSAEQRVAAAGTEVLNAQEGVRIATGRYKAGLGQFQDVLTAQQGLYTALSDQVNARAALETARVTFDHAIGAPVAAAH